MRIEVNFEKRHLLFLVLFLGVFGLGIGVVFAYTGNLIPPVTNKANTLGHSIDEIKWSQLGKCSPGYAISEINDDGSVVCEYDDSGGSSSCTYTGCTTPPTVTEVDPRLPSGTTGQTLRNQGGSWVASQVIQNDGSQVSIGGVGIKFLSGTLNMNNRDIDNVQNLKVKGDTFVNTPGSVSSASVCVTYDSGVGLYKLVRCTSSIKYKENVEGFGSGLDLVERLRPVTYDWKSNGERDLGLIAEEVEGVDSLLVNYDKDGVVDGVKYDRVVVVLINAIKEQQQQIDELIETVCGLDGSAEFC